MIFILKFAGFIIFILLITFGAYWFLYTSTIRFLAISDPGTRKAIMLISVLLGMSFFPSALLLRLHVNVFTSLLYLISCIWMGIFLYLIMALFPIWAIFWAGKLVGSIPDMRIITTVFFALALAVSLYGIWRSRNPELKQIEVTIKSLPDHWRNKIVVQLSDLHLGAINGTGFMKRVAEKVNSVRPEAIVITGDLFDGMGGDLPSFIAFLNSLKASKGVFFVTGNHEGYLGFDAPLAIIRNTNIRVLDNEIVDLEGLQIVGVSFPEHYRKNRVRSLLAQPGSFDSEKPSILLYHTPTNIAERDTDRGSQQTRTYWFPDTSMALAKQIGIDLQLSGHTHKGQLFPFGLLTRVVYNQHDRGLHKEGRFHLYVSSGVGTWGPPMRVDSPPEIVVINLR